MVIRARLAQESDRQALSYLFEANWSGEMDEGVDWLRYEWGFLRRLRDYVQKNGMFVATDDDDVIGIIFAEIRVDPFAKSEAFIKLHYILPEYRGNGIGVQLFDALMGHLSNMDIDLVKKRMLVIDNNLAGTKRKIRFETREVSKKPYATNLSEGSRGINSLG